MINWLLKIIEEHIQNIIMLIIISLVLFPFIFLFIFETAQECQEEVIVISLIETKGHFYTTHVYLTNKGYQENRKLVSPGQSFCSLYL